MINISIQTETAEEARKEMLALVGQPADLGKGDVSYMIGTAKDTDMIRSPRVEATKVEKAKSLGVATKALEAEIQRAADKAEKTRAAAEAKAEKAKAKAEAQGATDKAVKEVEKAISKAHKEQELDLLPKIIDLVVKHQKKHKKELTEWLADTGAERVTEIPEELQAEFLGKLEAL